VSRWKKKHTKELQESQFLILSKGILFFSALSWETSCIIQPLSDVWIFLYQKLVLMTFTLCRTNFAKVLVFEGGQRSIEKASSVFYFCLLEVLRNGKLSAFLSTVDERGRQRSSLSAGHSAENFIVTTVEFTVGTFLITWKYI
jgi:hypothetical protein